LFSRRLVGAYLKGLLVKKHLMSTLAAGLLLMGAAQASRANSVQIVTVNSNNGSEAAMATAVFTFSSGHLSIDLTNNVNNPHAAGSLLGGVSFTFATSGLGAPTNLSITGTLINITTKTPVAYAGNISSELGHWQLTSTSPDTIKAVANDPLIIGYGNGGLANSVYTNANSSLTGSSHNPFIQGTAHLEMDIAGLTDATQLSSVNFFFGTNFTSIAGTPSGPTPSGAAVATPLPAGAWGGLAMMGVMGIGARIRKARRPA